MRYREPALDQARNFDSESKLRTQQRRQKLGTTAIAVSGIVLSFGGVAANYIESQLGEVRDYTIGDGLVPGGPGRMSIGGIETPADDGQLRVMNWNMHNETGQRLDEIKLLLEEQHLDALLLQEVNATDATALGGHLPGYHVLFVVGEALPRPNYLQAYGNVIVTANQPYEINSARLDGSSVVETVASFVTGLPKDAWNQLFNEDNPNRPWQNTSTSWQENRAALQARVYVTIGDELVDVSLINTHLSYMRDSRIQNQQLDQLAEFVDDVADSADIEIVCGDFNTDSHSKVDQLFDRFTVPVTGPTTDYDHAAIDYCMVNTADSDYSLSVEVSDDYYTDHYALELTIDR